MSKGFAILVSSLFLFGCTFNSECARAICGCWKDHTQHTVIEVSDLNGRPTEDVSLFCEKTQESYGPSNELGLITTRIKGQVSPGCGFIAHCAIAVIRDGGGEVVGSIQIGRLVREFELTSGELTFKIATNGS